MNELVCAVYVSRRCPTLQNREIAEDIVPRSARRNQLAGVRGFLYFDSDRFVQAIEGPTPACCRLLRRIRTDRRHSEFRVLRQAGIASRRLSGFGAQGPPDPASAWIPGLIECADGVAEGDASGCAYLQMLIDRVIADVAAAQRAAPP